MMNLTLKNLLKWILFPFYGLLISFPNILKKLVFLYHKKEIRLSKNDCVFIINPKSGQKMGKWLIEVLKEQGLEQNIMNLLENDLIKFLKNHLSKLQKNQKLKIVVCGGDGSLSSVLDTLHNYFGSVDQFIFATMALGTGNEMSRMMNFGECIDIDSLHIFFKKINSDKCREVKIDTWKLFYKNELTGQTIKRQMLLFFGCGYTARTARLWEKFRVRFDFICTVRVF